MMFDAFHRKARRVSLVKRPFAVFAGAAMLAVTQPAHASGPGLASRPPATPLTHGDKRSGVLTLAGNAFAYLPKGNDGRPRPLLVALYGAGGRASDVLESFRADADRDGFILLIPTSAQGTWDMIEDLKSRIGIEMNVQPRYGKDLKAIDSALADLFGKVAIDRQHVGIMGFSDGATYALSVGTANPALFTNVIAFSPGPAFPSTFDPSQKIFISHGESDPVLPYSNTRGNVAKLRVKKMSVEFVKFAGKHEVPKQIHARAMAFFRGEGPDAPGD